MVYIVPYIVPKTESSKKLIDKSFVGSFFDRVGGVFCGSPYGVFCGSLMAHFAVVLWRVLR